MFVKITSNGKFVNFTQKRRRNDIGIDLLLKKYNQDDVALWNISKQKIYIYGKYCCVFLMFALYGMRIISNGESYVCIK